MPKLSLALLVATATLELSCAGPQKSAESAPGEQSYAEAISLICDVDRKAQIGPDANVLEIDERRTDFLQANIKNPDGIYFYTIFRTKPPAEQSTSLVEASKELGLKECPLAVTLQSSS